MKKKVKTKREQSKAEPKLVITESKNAKPVPPKPEGAKGVADMPALPVLPPHTLEDHNNPHWQIAMPMEIIRMDHSMHMAQHLGSIKDSEGNEGEVSLALGGFVFVVSVKTRNPRVPVFRYALDCTVAIETLFRLHDDLRKVAKAPNPIKPGSEPKVIDGEVVGVPSPKKRGG